MTRWIKIPEYADLMTVDDFVEQVKLTAFVNDDGSGYYARGNEYDHDAPARPSDVYKGVVSTEYTHVAWFNK